MSDSCHMLPELLNAVIRQDGRYGKIKDEKNFEKAISFLQENNVSTLSVLKEMLPEIKMQCQKNRRILQNATERITKIGVERSKYSQKRRLHTMKKQTENDKLTALYERLSHDDGGRIREH